MPEKLERVAPAKCTHCDKPMTTPLVCDYCHALFPKVAASSDYFAMLGVPRRFDLDEDELHRKFLALNRHAHPDFHANESPEVQQLSLSIASAVNDAYRTLKDPPARGAYLLELLGGKSSAEDKSVPDGFLETMLMMQAELEDATDADDREELTRLRDVLRTQQAGLIRRIAGLFGQLESAAACEAVRNDLLNEIRRQLNAVSYVRKLMSLAELVSPSGVVGKRNANGADAWD